MNSFKSRKSFSGKHLVLSFALAAIMCLAQSTSVTAAELIIQIDNPPLNGTVIAMLFNSSSTFVNLRDPVKAVVLPTGGANPERISGLAIGEYALVVYHDENGNGRLDENFIGIPSEPLGFSNRYWPQGPPAYNRASFTLAEGDTKTITIKLQSTLGKLGLVGVGVGIISQTSTYRGAKSWDVLPIPAISYIGDRVQILGTKALCGIADWGDFSLAATVSYRFGAYKENDSPYLQGMGNRDDTMLGGLALHYTLPAGFKLSTGYEHDLLNRTGGGVGSIGVAKAFQVGILTISPHVSLNWLTDTLADYEYGVSAAQARTNRSAYRPGTGGIFEIGATVSRELYKNWRIILGGGVAFLPANFRSSPIVDQAQVGKSFMAITRLY